jgi:hypothetical protein
MISAALFPSPATIIRFMHAPHHYQSMAGSYMHTITQQLHAYNNSERSRRPPQKADIIIHRFNTTHSIFCKNDIPIGSPIMLFERKSNNFLSMLLIGINFAAPIWLEKIIDAAVCVQGVHIAKKNNNTNNK